MPCETDSGCPIRGAQQDFRARLAAEIERGEEFLREQRSTDDEKAAQTGVALVVCAGGAVDPARCASLLAAERSADPTTLDRTDEAVAVLRDLGARVDDYTKIAVPPHGALRDTVAAALEQIGRVFGAARVVELARSGRYVEGEHARLLRGLPFARWSAAEREVAPWMRVILRGEQCHAAALAEFLDGGLKILLKPAGPCPPAPLAALLTPGVYVAQVATKADLDGFRSFDGPAAALLGGEGAALFTHDPRRGAQPWERLVVTDLPDPVRRAVGGISAFQANEGLALLRGLAAKPPAAPASAPEGAAVPDDPADRLAAWLLGQAGLEAGTGTGSAGA